MHESPAARYRRLARKCLAIANTFPEGEKRTVLVQMAQVWHRLSNDYGESTPLLRSIQSEQLVTQQQQQVQPKNDDKE